MCAIASAMVSRYVGVARMASGLKSWMSWISAFGSLRRKWA